MKDPLFSIIVPVYNTCEYIDVCLKSILNSEEQNYEVILVDDGSTDGSGKICDEYANGDKRFVVIHQENRGVSAARNVALGLAKGDWICMIDSDDEISCDFLNLSTSDMQYDMIVRSSVIVNSAGDAICDNQIRKTEVINEKKDVLCYSINRMRNPLWDKIIRRDVIGEIRFDEDIRIEEDFLFALSVIQKVHSVILSPVGKYIQYRRDDSAMQILLRNGSDFIENKMPIIDRLNKDFGSLPDRNYFISLLFKRFFPFFASRTYMFRLTKTQKEKMAWMLSLFHIQKLSYLSMRDKIVISVRIIVAKVFLAVGL